MSLSSRLVKAYVFSEMVEYFYHPSLLLFSYCNMCWYLSMRGFELFSSELERLLCCWGVVFGGRGMCVCVCVCVGVGVGVYICVCVCVFFFVCNMLLIVFYANPPYL